MSFTAQDRALEIALQSAHVIAIDGATSTDPRDYAPVVRDRKVHLEARHPEPIRIDIALTLNGRQHTVHFEQDERRNVRPLGLESSGMASLWITALDLFGVRFAYTRARDAAREINDWISGDGMTTDAGTFIRVLEMHLDGIAAMAAIEFEAKHNPFTPVAIAA